MIKGDAHLPYNTYESIRDLYYSYYSNVAPYQESKYDNNDEDKYSFNLNDFIYFYIDMHKLSGSIEWLDLINESCLKILDNTDEKRVARGELVITPLTDPISDTNYYQAPFPYQRDGIPVPGWSSFNGVSERLSRCQVLIDGQILGAICEAAKYIKNNEYTQYETLADDILSLSRRVLESHNNSWEYNFEKYGIIIKGSYKYPNRGGADQTYSHPLAYNHSAAFLKAMIICDEFESNPEYINKVQAFLDFTADTRQDLGDRWWWPYALYAPDGAEDINHGSYSLDFLYFAYKDGRFGLSREDMLKYSNAVMMGQRWPRVAEANEKIDGSGDMPGGEIFDVGKMAYLGEFNKGVIEFGKRLTATNFVSRYPAYFRSVASILLKTNFVER